MYGGKNAQAAREPASTFRSFRANLYLKEWKQWGWWLGADEQAIFVLLMEIHDENEALPREVEMCIIEGRQLLLGGRK